MLAPSENGELRRSNMGVTVAAVLGILVIELTTISILTSMYFFTIMTVHSDRMSHPRKALGTAVGEKKGLNKARYAFVCASCLMKLVPLHQSLVGQQRNS
mmetsp:Transcript_79995/g.156838  ORF Transcript_79995/g.156838 Transcript_79995/m.156838 type:complete len:100 (-) Transcript_79995:94-393(-)